MSDHRPECIAFPGTAFAGGGRGADICGCRIASQRFICL